LAKELSRDEGKKREKIPKSSLSFHPTNIDCSIVNPYRYPHKTAEEMQAALGRPPSNFTPNRPPYSQPGTARPPRRGQDRGQQKGPTPRQLARDNWAKLLAGRE